MVVTVSLHTILQRQTAQGLLSQVELSLPDGAAVSDALRALEITLQPAALILVIDHRVVDETTPFSPGDHLDIIPAISGGCKLLATYNHPDP